MKIGILGAGQLGRMLALSGYPLGHQFGFYGASDAPASALGKVFDPNLDKNALADFIHFADVITFESENTSVEQVRQIQQTVRVYPNAKSLQLSQHRGREKALFETLNIPCAPYQLVNSLEDLHCAIAQIGLPCVLKTTTQGYDGKGQVMIKSITQIKAAWQNMNGAEAILEGFVTFKRELSLIAVRAVNGEQKYYPLVENNHHRGILRLSNVPAQNVSAHVQKSAQQYMQDLLTHLDYVGVLTIELFETENGLMANEIAPRVHNSGHWSIEGAHTSQFENHIRALAQQPLGSTELTHPHAAMINIISKTGNTDAVLATQNAHLHLYDKQARNGRKLGHITLVARTQNELASTIAQFGDFLPADKP